MMLMQENLPHLVQGVFTSTVFIAAIMALRYFIIRMIRRDNAVLSKDRRRWVNRTKNVSIILIFVGLSMIWAPQLQTFALSLTAFVVAVVIATREMILCFVGSLFRISTQPYKVGDWITIDGVSGEVMEINTFTTRVEEIDLQKSYAYTGKSISIPNSKLFTAQVNMLNVVKRYVAMDIATNVQFTDLDPAVLLDLYKKTVAAHVDQFYDGAKSFMARVNRKAGITMPDPAASFAFRTTDLGHYVFSARIVVPTDRNGDIPAHIAVEFLSAVHKLRPAKSAPQQDVKAA